MDSANDDLRPIEWAYPTSGLGRLNDILKPRGPLPISRSAWWLGVKEGRFPQPVKLGPRTTAWRWRDVYALVEKGVA